MVTVPALPPKIAASLVVAADQNEFDPPLLYHAALAD
jgi:hypothetical protein